MRAFFGIGLRSAARKDRQLLGWILRIACVKMGEVRPLVHFP